MDFTHQLGRALIIIFLLSMPLQALACECGAGPIEAWKNGVVPQYAFAGKLIGTTTINTVAGKPYVVDMHFMVTRIWSGDIGETVTVRSNAFGSSCGWVATDVGEEYVIIAGGTDPDHLFTMSCSYNHLLSKSKIPALFGEGRPPTKDEVFDQADSSEALTTQHVVPVARAQQLSEPINHTVAVVEYSYLRDLLERLTRLLSRLFSL